MRRSTRAKRTRAGVKKQVTTQRRRKRPKTTVPVQEVLQEDEGDETEPIVVPEPTVVPSNQAEDILNSTSTPGPAVITSDVQTEANKGVEGPKNKKKSKYSSKLSESQFQTFINTYSILKGPKNEYNRSTSAKTETFRTVLMNMRGSCVCPDGFRSKSCRCKSTKGQFDSLWETWRNKYNVFQMQVTKYCSSKHVQRPEKIDESFMSKLVQSRYVSQRDSKNLLYMAKKFTGCTKLDHAFLTSTLVDDSDMINTSGSQSPRDFSTASGGVYARNSAKVSQENRRAVQRSARLSRVSRNLDRDSRNTNSHVNAPNTTQTNSNPANNSNPFSGLNFDSLGLRLGKNQVMLNLMNSIKKEDGTFELTRMNEVEMAYKTITKVME